MQLTVKSCNVLAANDFFNVFFLDGLKGSCCAIWSEKFSENLRVSFKRYNSFFFCYINKSY